MKMGYNGATSMKADLATDIACAAEAGFSGVEIWGAKLTEYLKKNSPESLKEIFHKHKVEPLSINSLEQATLSEGAKWQEIQKRMAELSRLAAVIGAKRVIVVPSPLGPQWQDRTRMLAKTVESLKILSKIAKDEGALGCFEMLGFGDCSVNTLALATDLVKQVDHPNMGLTLDTFHYYVGSSTVDMIAAVPKGKLFMVHINDSQDLPKAQLQDSNRMFPGEGSIPLDSIFGALKKAGYGGPVSIELFNPQYWTWDSKKIAKRAYETVNEVLCRN